MAVNNRRKRPKIRLQSTQIAPEIIEKEEVIQAPIVEEEQAPILNEIEEIVEAPVEEAVEEVSEEPIEEPAPIEEEPTEEVEETVEEAEEVPLEMSEEEMQVALDEEGSLDGTAEEVEELATEEPAEEIAEEPAVEEEEAPVEEAPIVEETPVEEVAEEPAPIEEPAVEEEEAPVEEAPIVEETPVEEVAEEPAPIEEPAVEEVVEEPVEEKFEEPAPIVEEEPIVDQTVEAQTEEVAATAEAIEELPEEDEEAEEEVVEEKPKKDEFKLTPPQNLDEILANICTKRGRKLIYRPNDVIFSHTTTVLGTDKANDEKIKVKNILDAEIKQGVKLGYLDKFDGLKMSELKEEYENDIVYEYADQEFKRTGILLDGDKVKVYVYDWDMKACHHVGCIDDESAELVKPYIIDREKYSFDINGIIVGGKYKKIVKDEKTGKITVEKGNDGNLGMEIDINIIARKD